MTVQDLDAGEAGRRAGLGRPRHAGGLVLTGEGNQGSAASQVAGGTGSRTGRS